MDFKCCSNLQKLFKFRKAILHPAEKERFDCPVLKTVQTKNNLKQIIFEGKLKRATNGINELGDIEEVQTVVPGIPEGANTSLEVEASESVEFGGGVTVLTTQGRDVQTVGHNVPDKYGYQISGDDVNIFTTLESGVAKSYRMPTTA